MCYSVEERTELSIWMYQFALQRQKSENKFHCKFNCTTTYLSMREEGGGNWAQGNVGGTDFASRLRKRSYMRLIKSSMKSTDHKRRSSLRARAKVLHALTTHCVWCCLVDVHWQCTTVVCDKRTAAPIDGSLRVRVRTNHCPVHLLFELACTSSRAQCVFSSVNSWQVSRVAAQTRDIDYRSLF